MTRVLLGAIALSLAGMSQPVRADDAPPENPPTVLDIMPTSIASWAYEAHGLNRGEESWNNCLSLLNALGLQEEGWEYKEIVVPESVKDLIDPHAPIAFSDRVTTLFVTDRDLAEQTLNARADIQDGEWWISDDRPDEIDGWSMFQGNWLITAYTTETPPITASQMVAETLPESELEILDDADAVGLLNGRWVSVGMQALGEELLYREVSDEIRFPDAEERQVRREIRLLVDGVQWVTGSMRVEFDEDDTELNTPTALSLHGGLFFEHVPGSAGALLLASHATPDRPSTLAGLPRGDVLFALAASFADGNKLSYYRQLGEIGQRYWNLYNRRSAPLPARQFYRIAEEVADHMQGIRIAAYRNPDPAADGLFSLVIIAEADEPSAFIAELQQMMRLAGADEVDLTNPNDAVTDAITDEEIEALVASLGDRVYRVRRDATNRLLLIGGRATPFLEARLEDESLELRTRASVILDQLAALQSDDARHFFGSDLLWRLDPDLRYVIAGETLADGTPVDWITVTVPEESQPYVQQFEAWLGPDWNRWRLAQTEDEIVICAGSRPELLKETLAILSDPAVLSLEIGGWNPEAREYQFQLHFDAHEFVPEVESPILSQLEPGQAPGLTSFGITLATDALTCDVHLPLTQLKRLMAWLTYRG